MAPYITLNQKRRTEARSAFSRDFFKLMNNSVFGKTCENQKKRTDIRLVTTEEQLNKLVSKPHFMDIRVFAEELCAVELQKVRLTINKPFYVGFAVLELAKLHMYEYASKPFSSFFVSLLAFL